MGKYLELFRGEVGDLTEKTKLENKPYVAYSTKLGKVSYTVVPAKDPVVEGPADNEIWYTSKSGSVFEPDLYSKLLPGDVEVISNTYNDGKGIIKFNKPVIGIDRVYTYDPESMENRSMPRFKNQYIAGEFVDAITSISLPDSVIEIGMSSFEGCNYLISIVIGNGVTSIGSRAFQDCSSLTSITFEGTIDEWNNITKEPDWNEGVPATYVQCTDGQVTL